VNASVDESVCPRSAPERGGDCLRDEVKFMKFMMSRVNSPGDTGPAAGAAAVARKDWSIAMAGT
jgi:hypothetical protein